MSLSKIKSAALTGLRETLGLTHCALQISADAVLRAEANTYKDVEESNKAVVNRISITDARKARLQHSLQKNVNKLKFNRA